MNGKVTAAGPKSLKFAGFKAIGFSYMKNYVKMVVAVVAVVTGLCSCRNDEPVNKALLDGIVLRKNNPWNLRSVDSAVTLLHSGDIVVRTGNDATSYMLCQLNTKDKTYSHCGIVMLENGYPFVYHSIGGEANPDARLRRDSANIWFSPANNLGFGVARLDMPAGSDTTLHRVVRGFYKERKKFDMDFDLTTEDRFYCAELVYKSVNQAVGDSQYLQPINFLGYTFVGIDDIFLNRHAHRICQIRFK
ncbi:MAG: hypothetical protein K0R82_2012 [Flavipsychrobacter sp.]|jgi:hypothetical protein|nr:hypothetical protein [Flavipsychrobacter sp.]